MSLGLRLLSQFFTPETAHRLALQSLRYLPGFILPKVKDSPVRLMNLDFPNRIGLAAGVDKNADYIDALAKLGFGFIEVGTVTPQAQPGNPQPRLFRLPAAEAIINRMGFDNKGVDYLISKLQACRYKGILGINIGKNRATPVDKALDDYLYCYDKVYAYASYIVINISSPNTPGLRDLQHGAAFTRLLDALKQRQRLYHQRSLRYVPLVIKISPDNRAEELQHMVRQCVAYKVDAITATNTTQDHSPVASLKHGDEQGGLSGAPLTARASAVLEQVAELAGDNLSIIGVGGIMSPEHAKQRLVAGASLIQLYSGLVYRGPRLIQAISHVIATNS